MIAFAIVICLFFVHVLVGRRIYAISVVGGFTTLGVLFLMMFGLLPGPVWVTELSLNGRRILWQNTISATMEAPLFGFGFGDYTEVVANPHNSFLRIFLALGIGGGIIYTLFVLWTMVQSTRETTNLLGFGISLYLVAFIFVQMLNSLTFIGVSFHSAFISLIIGYHIKNNASLDVHKKNPDSDQVIS
jgi:O-antigen ligase